MRITVDSRELSKVLARASRFAPTGNALLPVLQAFKLAVRGSALEVSAANLTTYATGRLAGEDAEDGTALVSAKLLAALTKSLSGKIQFQMDGDSLRVRAGKAKYALAVQASPDQFPDPGMPGPDASRIELDGDDLSSALAAVAFAAAKDETRPVLMGVRLSQAVKGDALHLHATDGIRVAQATIPAAGVPENFALTVPAVALRRLPLEGGPVVLIPSMTSLYIQADGWHYRTNLLEGQYPQVLQLLPQEGSAKTVVRVSRQGLRQAASRMGLLEAGAVRLAAQNSAADLALTSAAPQVGDASEVLEATLTFRDEEDAFQVVLNPAYLAEALDALEEDEAELRIVGSREPVTLVGRARRHDILPVVVG